MTSSSRVGGRGWRGSQRRRLGGGASAVEDAAEGEGRGRRGAWDADLGLFCFFVAEDGRGSRFFLFCFFCCGGGVCAFFFRSELVGVRFYVGSRVCSGFTITTMCFLSSIDRLVIRTQPPSHPKDSLSLFLSLPDLGGPLQTRVESGWPWPWPWMPSAPCSARPSRR